MGDEISLDFPAATYWSLILIILLSSTMNTLELEVPHADGAVGNHSDEGVGWFVTVDLGPFLFTAYSIHIIKNWGARL
jgi:hypothetical protein